MRWKDSCHKLTASSVKHTRSSVFSGLTKLPQGWALKKHRKNTRFTDDIKIFLSSVFDEGERSGNKANPAKVARNMRVSCNIDGIKRFKASEVLQPSQIASFFSRLAAQAQNPEIRDDELESAIALINKAEALEELDLAL